MWSQELDAEFSQDSCLKCRRLHGHQGKVIIHLTSDKLKNGMVTDFNHLNWFKKFLDNTLDHKFIIDINDPLFETMLPHYADKKNLVEFKENYKMPDLTHLKNEPNHIYEMYEGYIIVDFVPTSESLCEWLYKIVQKKMDEINVKVAQIEFYESPKSRSVVFN